jgi:hypothetical protein
MVMSGIQTSVWSRPAVRNLAPGVAFLVTLLLITLPRGLNSTVTAYAIPVTTRSAAAVKIFGLSDSGSLLGAAIAWQKQGHIFSNHFWVLDDWPPGMVAVDRLLLSFESGLGIPITLSMVLLNCVVWAAFLGFVFVLLWRWKSFWIALLFGAGALLYSGVSIWGLQSGLFYSDSFGAIAYCWSLLFLLLTVRAQTFRRRLWLAGIAGVFLALASYFRASFELVADATLVIAAVVVVILLIARRRGRVSPVALPAFVSLGVTGAVAQAVMLPWRAYAGLRIHIGDFRWSTVADLTSAARWIPDSLLLKENARFAADGHSNWACLDDPVECKRIFALEETTKAPYSAGPNGYFTGAQLDHLTFESILAHPFTYLFERIDALTFGFASNTGGPVKDLALPESLIMGALLVAAIIVIVRSRTILNPAYLFFLFATVVQIGTLALIHMEPRYFLGVELSIVVMAPFILARSRVPLRAGPVAGDEPLT